jgi:hypothetical protein
MQGTVRYSFPDHHRGGRVAYQQEQDRGTRGAMLGDALLVAGGVLIGIGVLLPWGRAVVGPFHHDVAGIKGWEGQVTGILAVGMVLRGISAWNANKRGERSRLAGATVVTGLVAAGIAVYDLFTARSHALDRVIGDGASTIARQVGLPVDVVTNRLKAMVESGVIRLDFQIGIYLVVLGGLVAVAGSVLALVRQSQAGSRPAPAPAAVWPAPIQWPSTPAPQGTGGFLGRSHSVTPADTDPQRPVSPTEEPGETGTFIG